VGNEAREPFRPRHTLAVQARFERTDLPDDGGHIVVQRPPPQQKIGGFVHLDAVHHRVNSQVGDKRINGGGAGQHLNPHAERVSPIPAPGTAVHGDQRVSVDCEGNRRMIQSGFQDTDAMCS